MKITIFNPDGSVKEVQERHFQIDEHITSFVPDRSFININEDDIIAIDEDDAFFKDSSIFKVSTQIKHDIFNYAKMLMCRTDSSTLIEKVMQTELSLEELSSTNRILRRFIRSHIETRFASVGPIAALSEEETAIMDVKLLVQVLLYNLKLSKYKVGSNNWCKYLLNQIHWLYYALKNCQDLDILPQGGVDAMYVLYPFANLKFPFVGDLLGKKLIMKYMDSLFFTSAQYRSELYRIILALGYQPFPKLMSHPITDTFAMEQIDKTGRMYTLMEVDSGTIDDIKIELEKEEIVSIYTPCPASVEIKKSIREILEKKYNEFCNKNGEFLKKNTEKNAMLFFKYKSPEELVRIDWENYYFGYLNNLQNRYQGKNDIPYGLETPLFYYYVLAEECEICKEYVFDGVLLDAIVTRLILKKGKENKQALYEQIFRLNYIESSAEMIETGEIISEEDTAEGKRRKELRTYFDELCLSDDKEIAQDLEKGKFELDDEDEAIKYFLVWLSPLFKYSKIYLNEKAKIEINDFKEKLRKVLGSDTIYSRLLEDRKRIALKHNLNIKLVLGIIGYLSDKGKENFRNIINQRKGYRLERDLKYLWNMKTGTGSYHNYISGYEQTAGLNSEMKKKY